MNWDTGMSTFFVIFFSCLLSQSNATNIFRALNNLNVISLLFEVTQNLVFSPHASAHVNLLIRCLKPQVCDGRVLYATGGQLKLSPPHMMIMLLLHWRVYDLWLKVYLFCMLFAIELCVVICMLCLYVFGVCWEFIIINDNCCVKSSLPFHCFNTVWRRLHGHSAQI